MAHVYSGGGRPGGRLHTAVPEEEDAGAGYGIYGGHVHRERADQVPGLRPESFFRGMEHRFRRGHRQGRAYHPVFRPDCVYRGAASACIHSAAPVAAPAAIAMVWRWLFNSEFGLLNHIFHTKINWISDPKIAVYAIAVIGVWSIIGYNMVLFLSGLQEIPRDYYEAASIDGATGVKQFFYITIPLLSPTIFFVMVTRVIGAMQVFDLIFMVMDRNSPALYKTQSLVYLFYQNSFVQNNKGYGSTIVVLLLVVIMIMTVFQNIAQKKWVHYN